jgi:SpoVK/Ycf46/Vps4 family AAA+-type ATPase
MPSGWKRSDPRASLAAAGAASGTPQAEPAAARGTSQAEPAESMSNSARAGAAEKSAAVSWSDLWLPQRALRRLQDLVVPPRVLQRIEQALSRIRHHKKLYVDWDLRRIDPRGCRIVVNLHGEPGTGKSFCAEALADALGKEIIRIDYAELISKYVGETGARIAGAFRKAAQTGAVLFFDEADTVLGARINKPSQSSDKGVNDAVTVMLMEMDRFEGVLIFATNRLDNYDYAFMRRILTHIEFELPDRECLVRLWRGLFPEQMPRAADVDFASLADHSAGLAGGDLLNVVLLAAGRAVERSEDRCKVERADLVEELEEVRKVKARNRGTRPAAPVQVTETILTREELPDEETKGRFDACVVSAAPGSAQRQADTGEREPQHGRGRAEAADDDAFGGEAASIRRQGEGEAAAGPESSQGQSEGRGGTREEGGRASGETNQ